MQVRWMLYQPSAHCIICNLCYCIVISVIKTRCRQLYTTSFSCKLSRVLGPRSQSYKVVLGNAEMKTAPSHSFLPHQAFRIASLHTSFLKTVHCWSMFVMLFHFLLDGGFLSFFFTGSSSSLLAWFNYRQTVVFVWNQNLWKTLLQKCSKFNIVE